MDGKQKEQFFYREELLFLYSKFIESKKMGKMKKLLKIFLAYILLIGTSGLLLTGLVISMIVLGFRFFEGWLGLIIVTLVIFPFLILFSLAFSLFEFLIDNYF